MIARLAEGVRLRTLIALGVLLVLFVAAPLAASDYLLTVLTLILYFAYTGQAWNIMMGFAGQLSLGHALYVGLGAYTAAALFVHFGIGPWLGLLVAVPVAAGAGAFIGFLAFRFRVAGVYFAILTIAVAEFARVGFEHLTWTGATAGLFLPVAQYTHNDVWNLRGHPVMFYYILLGATVFSLAGFVNAMFAKKFDDIALVPTFVLTPLTYLGGIFYSVHMLPGIFQKISLANPILYMVNAFRYGFLGLSDVGLGTCFAVMGGLTLFMFLWTMILFRRGAGLKR